MSPFKDGREKKLWIALIVSWVLIFLILLGSTVYTSVSLIGVKNKIAQINPDTFRKIQDELTKIESRPPVNGQNGKDGVNGVNGADGTNGTNGENGTNAVSTYVEKDNTIVQQVPLQGTQGLVGPAGADGKTVQIGKTTDGQIVWRFDTDREWQLPYSADVNSEDLTVN